MKKSIRSMALCFLLVLGCLCAWPLAVIAQDSPNELPPIYPPKGDNTYSIAKLWDARIQELGQGKSYPRMLEETKVYLTWIQQQKDERISSIFMPKAFSLQASAWAGQGYYGEAVASIKRGDTYPNANLKESYYKYSRMNELQGEYFKLSIGLNQERNKLMDSLLNLNEQKTKMLDEMLQRPNISPKDLKYAQDRLAALEKERETLRGRLQDVSYRMEKYLNQDKFQGMVLNPSQAAEVAQISKQADEKAARDNDLGASVKIKLLQVAEKSGQVWKELNAKLEAMARLQSQIRSMQKEMLTMMGQKPLSDKAKQTIKELNARMDKLNAEYQKLFDGIEQSYQNAAGFEPYPGQAAELKVQIARFRELRDEINSTDKEIEAFIAEMERASKKLGDLNGDGKIDKADLHAMLPMIFAGFFRKVPNNPLADVDGDGKVTLRDFQLMREAVNGERKVFPADPKYIAGDVDGNGKLDISDAIRLLQKYGKKSKKVEGRLEKLLDINGDGVLDSKDAIAVLRKVAGLDKAEKPATTENTTPTTASTTPVIPENTDNQHGNEATGSSQIGQPDSQTQPGNSAGSMGDN